MTLLNAEQLPQSRREAAFKARNVSRLGVLAHRIGYARHSRLCKGASGLSSSGCRAY